MSLFSFTSSKWDDIQSKNKKNAQLYPPPPPTQGTFSAICLLYFRVAITPELGDKPYCGLFASRLVDSPYIPMRDNGIPVYQKA